MEYAELLSVFRALAHGCNPESGKTLSTGSIVLRPKVKAALKAAITIINEYSIKTDGPINMGKIWSTSDERALLIKHGKGYSDKTIASELGRTTYGVRAHLEKLGIRN